MSLLYKILKDVDVGDWVDRNMAYCRNDEVNDTINELEIMLQNMRRYEIETKYISEWDKTIIQVHEIVSEDVVTTYTTYLCGDDLGRSLGDITIDVTTGKIKCLVTEF